MLIRDPVIASKIAQWRDKLAQGTLSIEEMHEIVVTTRQGRMQAAEASKASRKASTKKPQLSAEEMMDEIDKL